MPDAKLVDARIASLERELTELRSTVEALTSNANADRALLSPAEPRRQAREEQLRLFVEHVPTVVAMFDRDMRYLVASRRWMSAHGLEDADLTGRVHYDVFPELPERWREIYERALAGEVVSSAEDRWDRADGSSRWIRWEVSPWPASDGSVGGVLIAMEDVSECRLVQEQLRRNHDTFFHLIENNPFGIFVVDADFRLRQVSVGARKPFENVHPLLGRDFDEVLRVVWPEPFVSEALGRFRHTLATGEPYVAKRTIEQRADLEVVEAYDWRIERVELPDGRLGVVCYFYDLSERQRWEAELVARETDRKRAEAALKDADQRKDEFLAILAHELRNPLAPIRGGVDLLRQHGVSAKLTTKALDVIHRQLGQLVRLVDDLLDVSRIGRGTIGLQRGRMTMRTIVEHAIETSRPLVEARGHVLSVTLPQAPVWVHADLTRFAQVVGNLLNNAAKYTPTAGRIELSVEVEGEAVVIRVADDGIGIAPDDLSRVFDMFTQVGRTTDHVHGGLGIGLALVRSLVALHDGTIVAESAGLGQGSTFTVRLPVEPMTSDLEDAGR